MKKILTILALLIVFIGNGCFRQDIKTFTVSTPQMKNRECAKIIADAAMSIKGVRNVELKLADKEVAVTYNSLKIAEKNVETAIARAGFDANTVLATPKSRRELPEKLK